MDVLAQDQTVVGRPLVHHFDERGFVDAAPPIEGNPEHPVGVARRRLPTIHPDLEDRKTGKVEYSFC